MPTPLPKQLSSQGHIIPGLLSQQLRAVLARGFYEVTPNPLQSGTNSFTVTSVPLLQHNTKEEKLSMLSAASKYSCSAITSFFPEPLTSALREKTSQGCLTLQAVPIWRAEIATSPSAGMHHPDLGHSQQQLSACR